MFYVSALLHVRAVLEGPGSESALSEGIRHGDPAEAAVHHQRISSPYIRVSGRHRLKKSNSSIGNMASSLNTKFDDQSQIVPINNEQRISLPNFVSGDFKELDEKVKSMMVEGQKMIPSGKQANGTPKQQTSRICKLRGKEGAGIAIRDHIEANHLAFPAMSVEKCSGLDIL